MDLLDRYLAAVAALLPKGQRPESEKWDIVAELRDILLNRMEEKEAELGRSLTANEREAVLKAFGHPIAVAGRFGTTRSLIGPEIYPFYLFGVKALLVVAAIVSGIQAVVSVITSPAGAGGVLAQFLSGFLSSGFSLIGVATVVAVAFERGWIPRTGFADWKVADLPVLDALVPVKKSLFRRSPLERRFEALLEVILTALFILWWTGLVQTPWSNEIGRGDMAIEPTAIWTSLHLPILAWAGMQLAASVVGLLRPSWVRARATLDVVCGLAGLAVAGALWSAGSLVTVAPLVGEDLNAERVANLQTALDQSFHITLIVMTTVLLVKIAIEFWRLFRGAKSPVSALV